MLIAIENIRHEKGRAFFGWMLVLFSIVIVVMVNLINAKYNSVINRTFVFALILLTLCCINSKALRNSIGIIPLVLIAADLSLQLYAWSNFNTKFTLWISR